MQNYKQTTSLCVTLKILLFFNSYFVMKLNNLIKIDRAGILDQKCTKLTTLIDGKYLVITVSKSNIENVTCKKYEIFIRNDFVTFSFKYTSLF